MRYDAWAPRYEAIRREFGFPYAREEAAAATLERLLRPADRREPLPRIAPRLEGGDAIVVGDAPDAGPPPLWRLPPAFDRPRIVAADGATVACLRAGIVPAVIASDLDGPVPSEVAANERGSLVVVHAHGDNVEALERWVPEFPGELAGSWAGPPRSALLDVGGFTDGDRGAYLAEAVGARAILLWGFDFERVADDEPARAARKRAKLGWAARLLGELAATAAAPVLEWRRDGTLVPYRTGSSVTTTR